MVNSSSSKRFTSEVGASLASSRAAANAGWSGVNVTAALPAMAALRKLRRLVASFASLFLPDISRSFPLSNHGLEIAGNIVIDLDILWRASLPKVRFGWALQGN